MYYIKNGLGSKKIASFFAAACIFSSFCIGNMSQTNAVAISFSSAFGLNGIISGMIIALFCAFIIIGGVKRILNFTSFIIPFLSIFYFIFSFIVIIHNYSSIPLVFLKIITGAFSFKCAGYGFMGFLIARSMRFGISRGIFSNEAGLGSAPIAHASAEVDSPVKQGFWGIFEVFFDTIIICSVTAFVVLTAGLYEKGIDGINLTGISFATVFGSFSDIFLAVSIFLFALSTLVTWNFYGEKCLIFLFGNSKKNILDRIILIYKYIFLMIIVFGCVLDSRYIWLFADIFNAMMALPNIYAIMKLSPIVMNETKLYFKSINLKL